MRPLRRSFIRVLLTGTIGFAAVLASAPVRARDVSQPIVSGTVRDDTGDPVVNVEVVALHRAPGHRRFEIRGRARTDDRGRYRIVVESMGLGSDYLIRVNGDETRRPLARQFVVSATAVVTYPTVYYPAASRPSSAVTVTVKLYEDVGGIDFTLSPLRGVRVAGTIAGVKNVPARFLEVSLLPLDGTEVQWDLPLASVGVPADGDGRFWFSNVPRGTYVLSAVAFPRHAMRSTPWVHAPTETFFGVVEVFGRPGSEAVGPPPAGDTHWIKERVVIDADDVSLTLQLNRGARLSGRLVFDGTSARPIVNELTGTVVWIFPTDGRELGNVPISGVDANGRFDVVGLPPGDYELVLSGLGASAWRQRSVTMNGKDVTGRWIQVGIDDVTDLTYSFTDRRTRLVGRLRDASGRAVEVGSVVVFPTDRSLWMTGVRSSSVVVAQSTEEGAFDATVLGGGENFLAGGPHVSSALRERLQDPSVLDELSRSATIVRVGEGQTATVAVTAAAEK